MANERLIFLACNIYSILAEYSLHSCTFRWALWPMALWLTLVTGNRKSCDWIFLSRYWVKHPLMGTPTVGWIQGYLLRHWHTTCHSLFNSLTINQSFNQAWCTDVSIHLVNRWLLLWHSLSLNNTHSKACSRIVVKKLSNSKWDLSF